MGCLHNTTILTESTNLYSTRNTSPPILKQLKESNNVSSIEYEDTFSIESEDTFSIESEDTVSKEPANVALINLIYMRYEGPIYFSKAIAYAEFGLTDKSIIYLKKAARCYHKDAFCRLIELYRDNYMMRKCAIYSSISRLLP